MTALEGWRLRPSPPPKIPRFDCSLLQSNPALPEMEGQDIFAVIDGKDTGIPGDFGGHKKEGGVQHSPSGGLQPEPEGSKFSLKIFCQGLT